MRLTFERVKPVLMWLQEVLETDFEDWDDLYAYAGKLLTMAAVHPYHFDHACRHIGREQALTILAILVEKRLRSPDSIAIPERYYRACVNWAKTGQLEYPRFLNDRKWPIDKVYNTPHAG